MFYRSFRPLALLTVVGVMSTVGFVVATPMPARAASTRRRNILFVLTDDLDLAELRFMPNTLALIGQRGATFDRYLISNSLCCPSRVTTLRGQYAHNTEVWSNGGSNGGFQRAFARGLENDTVATRLRKSGYLTGLFGKYLNGYPATASPNYVPPGWTTWSSAVAGDPYGEYNYVLNHDGKFVVHPHKASDYGTDVYVAQAQDLIRDSARRHHPFFAYLSVYAPHQPARPAPQDTHKFPHAQVPRDSSFDQADVSTSPHYVRDLPRFSTAETAQIDRLYRLRIRSLQAVDRGVGRLVDTLRATGQLDNTYIVFTSDNGFHLGQHRLPAGKQTPYDTDIHVPFLVRGPGITAGAHVGRLAGNVDLAPTFEAMADVRPAPFTDGRSLLPLLDGDSPSTWRRAYLVEHRDEVGATNRVAPDAKPSPLEPPDPDQVAAPRHRHHRPTEIHDHTMMRRRSVIPDYDAVRTDRYLYVEYATGERELYDTRTDPTEVHNLAGYRPHLEHDLSTRVRRLERCRARSCRAIEEAPIS